MRLYVKKQMLDLTDTIIEAVNYMKQNSYLNGNYMIDNCIQAVDIIKKNIAVEDNYNDVILLIDTLSQEFYSLSKSENEINLFQSNCDKIVEQIEQIKEYISEKVRHKIEIVFFPYKSSMWDCMESVWESAKKTDNCECYVVPIPYFEINGNGVEPELCYEGSNFQKDVPIVPYWEYDLERRHPDVIYFHNPYDQFNTVTQVKDTYFSSNLKKYTDMLVYIPYFVEGSYNDLKIARQICATSGAENADRIVLQSESYKELFIKLGFSKDKLLVLGSPKFDATLLASKRYDKVPDKWKKALENRKVFLWNSSLFNMFNNTKWIEQMNEIIDPFYDNDNCALIWRPHPLMDTSIQSQSYQYKVEYDRLKERLSNMGNIIIDYEPDTYQAIAASDALISDYSSIMLQYIITGKPILSVDGRSSSKEKCICILDYFSNYFLQDDMSVKAFMEMVLAGEDLKKEDRLNALKKSTINVDGKCGKTVHQCVINELVTRK